MDVYKTYNFEDGRKLEIILDNAHESPREWDNIGIMVCFHRDNYGDTDHDYKADEFNGWDELEKQIREDHPDSIILPIYMYEHGGVTIKTTPFNCNWDSGRIGLIFISREKINEEYGNSRTDEEIKKYLRGEVETYDQFLKGDVWGYILRDKPCDKCGGEGKDRDSCWGFYGDDPIENGMVEYLDKKYRKELVALV